MPKFWELRIYKWLHFFPLRVDEFSGQRIHDAGVAADEEAEQAAKGGHESDLGEI